MVNGKKPADCLTIDEVREEIDRIDEKIIELFAERDGFVKEIVKFKSDEEGIVAQERKDFVIRKRGEWAKKYGLNPELFSHLYTLLIDDNIKKELEILKSKKS